jgi:hypothetical protein
MRMINRKRPIKSIKFNTILSLFCLNLNQTHRKANLKLSARIETRFDNKIDPASMKASTKVDNIDLIQQKKWSKINTNKDLNQRKAKLKLSADRNARR